MTEKANEFKKIESLKEAKQIQKEQLAKKYDEIIANSKPKEEVIKPKEEVKEIPKEEPKEQPKEQSKEQPKPIKKKRIIKKITYQEATSSDSESADEVEVIKVKKQQPKNKNNEVEKPPQNINNSYSNLLYEASVDKLKNRMMDERAKHLIMSVMPNYN